jgi:hypothetical protein
VLSFPVTLIAFPLQFAAVVQLRKHCGYTSRVPTHVAQFSLALYRQGHLSQLRFVHWCRHTHVQLSSSPLTETAFAPLQSAPTVQILRQFGYPA